MSQVANGAAVGDPAPLNNYAYPIKDQIGALAYMQEPIVGRWYCHFESIVSQPGIPVEREYERDGNIGQYEGCGQFCDEEGADIEMSGDINSPWQDYLILQD